MAAAQVKFEGSNPLPRLRACCCRPDNTTHTWRTTQVHGVASSCSRHSHKRPAILFIYLVHQQRSGGGNTSCIVWTSARIGSSAAAQPPKPPRPWCSTPSACGWHASAQPPQRASTSHASTPCNPPPPPLPNPPPGLVAATGLARAVMLRLVLILPPLLLRVGPAVVLVLIKALIIRALVGSLILDHAHTSLYDAYKES